MDPIRIFLADDHQIMREGLRLVLNREADFAIVGEAADGEAALVQLKVLKPEVAVLDIEMPGLNGLELAEHLRTVCPETKVLILSAHAEAPAVREALRAGVAGFLMKTGAAADLVRAIRTIVAGEVFFCPQVSTVLVREYRRAGGRGNPATTLTDRETEVLKRIADGQSTKEIAFALGVSGKTVETHRLNVMTKLGVTSVAALTKYALREGLTTL